jgi:cyclopropane-fatty-acyl-phospholipid synthase
MANQVEIEDHYDTLGTLHALRLKEIHEGYPDYTCAFFDGDFSKTLKQAQEDKHAWIFDGLGLGQDLTGKRILDIGCGWGPMLHAVRARGGQGVGLTLSPGQVAYCTSKDLDVRLMDYKKVQVGELGEFDAIISIGAFEHFSSVEEFKAGKQEQIYREFFDICARLLKPGGKLYLQTMMWGKKVPDYDKLSLKAPVHSEEAILARLEKFYPGSWLPAGLEQIKKAADSDFIFIKTNNGRLDYIETLKRWAAASKNLLTPSILPSALKAGIPLLIKSVFDRDTRIQLMALRYKDQRECFIREIMSHERMFYVKR